MIFANGALYAGRDSEYLVGKPVWRDLSSQVIVLNRQ